MRTVFCTTFCTVTATKSLNITALSSAEQTGADEPKDTGQRLLTAISACMVHANLVAMRICIIVCGWRLIFEVCGAFSIEACTVLNIVILH